MGIEVRQGDARGIKFFGEERVPKILNDGAFKKDVGAVLKRMIANITIKVDREAHSGESGFVRELIMLCQPE